MNPHRELAIPLDTNKDRWAYTCKPTDLESLDVEAYTRTSSHRLDIRDFQVENGV